MNAVPNNELNVEYFSDIDDAATASSDDLAPPKKSRTFEFSDNTSLMRIIRLILCIQALGILVDNPSIYIPLLFRIFCKTILFYSIRFYSRPFADIVYLLQYFMAKLAEFMNNLSEKAKYGVKLGTSFRRLEESSGFIKVDLLDDQSWHATIFFTHYFLGIFFAFFFVAFTLRFWEIKDFSDRDEVRQWLDRYVADGWWRKGGLMVAVNTLRGLLMLAFVVFVLYASAHQFNASALPDSRVVGSFLGLLCCVVTIVWILGYFYIRGTEMAFVRYVSQNVSYTSAMILKKAVKTKVEIGILLMLIVFTPVCYNLLQSLTVMVDWNDNWASTARRGVNKFVPCYFMAFPPYISTDVSPNTCSYVNTISPLSPQANSPMFHMHNILQCDTLLGSVFFLFGTVCFSLVSLSYFYVLWCLYSTLNTELKSSKWVQSLTALLELRKIEIDHYVKHFSLWQRIRVGAWNELMWQLLLLKRSLASIVPAIQGYAYLIYLIIVFPMKCIFGPFVYVFSHLFTLGCANLTREGKKRKFRAQQLRKLNAEMSYKSRPQRHSVAKYFNQVDEDAALAATEDVDLRSFQEVCIDFAIAIAMKLASWGSSLQLVKNRLVKRVKTSESWTYWVARSHFMMRSIKSTLQGGRGKHTIGEHVSHAPWRKATKAGSKTRLLQEIDHHILEEISRIKHEFIMDHALCITVFDTTIDSSGLLILSCAFHWNKLYWIFVVLVEMLVYSFIGTLSNYHTDWQTRTQLILVANIGFSLVTYAASPYTEMTDRTLDFMGRILVAGTAVGILICFATVPKDVLNQPQDAPMYKPWVSFLHVASQNPFQAGLYLLVDSVMVIYFYSFIIYVLRLAGAFDTIQSKIRGYIYAFHDHILDLLVEKLDERTIGLENVYSGLKLVQQWDDIIDEQKRYALLTYPDVRPPWHLTPLQKMVEIKWAAMWDFTIPNVRSSLGLTLLHTVLCSGDCESARWLIHRYPELLMVEDMQRDTPVAIALKEAAFFVIKFSEQNNGALNDGTSYGDENFDEYYPEVQAYRDTVSQYGEFIPADAEIYNMRSIEIEQLVRFGYFNEVRGTKQDIIPTFYEQKLQQRLAAEEAAAAAAEEALGGSSVAGDVKMKQLTGAGAPGLKLGGSVASADDSVKMARERKLVAQARRNAAKERIQLSMPRFPEDLCENNLETGQMDAWKMIGLEVSDNNLYMNDVVPTVGQDFGDDEMHEFVEVDEHHAPPADLRYNISTLSKSVFNVEDVAKLPSNHPEYEKMNDWMYMKGKKVVKNQTLLGAISTNKQADIETGGIGERTSLLLLSSLLGNNDLESRLREVRWRLCKYTELFLSKEVSKNCRDLKWDINVYKEWNKLSSSEQGRVAQNLAMVYHLKPPAGFSRVSEWTQGIVVSDFDEPDIKGLDTNVLERGVVAMVNATQKATAVVARTFKKIKRSLPMAPRGSTVGSEDSSLAFNDRIIQYLSESLVSSNERLDLNDCELSVYGRYGWRAVVRALRRKYCTFVLPSSFVPAKRIIIMHLELPRNELDCGDAVMVADAMLYQQHLIYVDLSYNRIGSRGMKRMCKVLKPHENLRTFKIDHNRIGPGAGAEIGAWLKQSKALRFLSLSHNRLGALTRYSSLHVRERMPSAAREIFFGLRLNRYLQFLDLSYNHLGPDCTTYIPLAVNNHPFLLSLNISGNDIGSERGAALLFGLAGEPQGEKAMLDRIKYFAELREKERRGVDIVAEVRNALKEMGLPPRPKLPKRHKLIQGSIASESHQLAPVLEGSPVPPTPPKEKKKVKSSKRFRPCRLAEICIADNQLGYMSGYGCAALLNRNKALTSLDISSNALHTVGGLAISTMIEKLYDIDSLDLHRKAIKFLEKEDAEKSRIRRVLYTNLTSLDISRNGIGPKVMGSLSLCLSDSNCTITSLNVSDNPIGLSNPAVGIADEFSNEIRSAFGSCKTMTRLELGSTFFHPTQLVTLIGGIQMNKCLLTLNFRDVYLDEPSSLQLSHAITCCSTLESLNLRNCKMGPQAGLIVMGRIAHAQCRFRFLDLTGNKLGPRSGPSIAKVITDPSCVLEKVYLSNNDLSEGGGYVVGTALLTNSSIREIDISDNSFNANVGEVFSTVCRGIFKHGRLVSPCKIVSINLSDNPDIGKVVGKELVRALISGSFKRVEVANIGITLSAIEVLSNSFRNVALTWEYCDLSRNSFGREGMNKLCWSLRVNRSIRVLICQDNRAGPVFGTEQDTLLSHGISLPNMIRSNVVLRELDLSFNGLSAGMGVLLFEAMLDNYSIRRLTVRGNLLDDTVSVALGDLIRYNDIIEDLDLGENRLGYDCCFSIATGLEVNHAIRIFNLDCNRLGNAAVASIDALSRALMVNYSLRVLNLDGNKIGPEGGIKLSDMLVRNNTIRQLALRDNRLDERSGRSLLNAYTHNIHLMELGLSADEVGVTIWEQFVKVYKLKRATLSPEDTLLDTLVSEDASRIIESYMESYV